MKVIDDGHTYVFSFHHEKDPKGCMVTTCYITHDGHYLNPIQAFARCGKQDQFIKETGRKTALTRALHFIDNKGLRTKFWQAYFARK